MVNNELSDTQLAENMRFYADKGRSKCIDNAI